MTALAVAVRVMRKKNGFDSSGGRCALFMLPELKFAEIFETRKDLSLSVVFMVKPFKNI